MINALPWQLNTKIALLRVIAATIIEMMIKPQFRNFKAMSFLVVYRDDFYAKFVCEKVAREIV